MTTEKDKTLEALKIAMQMENDGKEYYLRLSQQSSNELGKKLLETLSCEEDYHRQRFEEIYNTVRDKKEWPTLSLQTDAGEMLRSIFSSATEKIAAEAKTVATEIDAVKTAMEMENRSYDFYKNQERNSTYPSESKYYQALANEEREHHLVLLDYYEYLQDPAAWFAAKEHSSQDGG